MAQRLRAPRASEVLAERIRRQIMSESLPAGALLPATDELMETHGVSRATVREAMRLLEAAGLIRVRRGRDGGIQVERPAPRLITRTLASGLYFEKSTVAELFEARLLLEPYVARRAAENANSTAVQALKAAFVQTQGSGSRTMEQGVDFHSLVGRASGNSVLMFLTEALVQLIRFHTRIVHLPASELGTMEDVHLRIVDLIARGDADGAGKVMRHHIEGIRDFTQQQHGDLEHLPILEGASSWMDDLL